MSEITDMTKVDQATGQLSGTPGPSKKERLRALVSRRSGASLEKLVADLGWQPHTARAALSSLRKSGEQIERAASEKGAVYRIVKPEAS